MWYEHLTVILENLGFSKNAQDGCVFNRSNPDGSQTTIAVHVDDGLITAPNEPEIDVLVDQLKDLFPDLNVHRGHVHNYLGMVMDFSLPGKCKITMDKYVEDLLRDCKVAGIATSPASEHLFEVRDLPMLSEADRQEFHTGVAKCLYLAKRTRPDILTPVAFLSTRVQKATADDWKKLERVYKYLRGTKELGIVLEPDNKLSMFAYIDASYGVHADYKSHTGMVVGIGRGPMFAKSAKQRIVTKSSTEAELVGLSDGTSQVVWTRNFLIEQGYDLGPATVYQDNQSTMALVKAGRSTSERTRHIAIRFFFTADRVKAGEIAVEYCPTESMIADVLTKPLQGDHFIRMRNQLLNWTE